MVVTTGASVLRTMMTCRPLVSVTRNRSGSAAMLLVAARPAKEPASARQKMKVNKMDGDV